MSPASAAPRPPVAILCGGRGTRLRGHTQELPKPLVEIGGYPIVWHVIRLYAAHGFERFLLLTGYKGELIERFAAAQRWPARVSVQCVDTGLETGTGDELVVLGDTVNVAARLQQAAGAGQILVGEPTYALTSRAFEYRKLPPLHSHC